MNNVEKIMQNGKAFLLTIKYRFERIFETFVLDYLS